VRLVFGFSGRYIPLGRDFEAVVSIGFWVHASACLSVLYDAGMILRSQSAQGSVGFFSLYEDLRPSGWGDLFSISWFYLSFGNYSLYTTRLFEEGSAYL